MELIKLLLVACASEIALAAPQPEITPRAILPRVNYQTLGWYSDGTKDGLTIYESWWDDQDETTYTTSGQWFRRCPATESCLMYTGCSNGYVVAPDTSEYCGAGGASGSSFCSNHVLYPTSGAPSGLSWYWCDTAPLTGITMYASLPANAYIAGDVTSDLSSEFSSAILTATSTAISTTSDTSSSTASGSSTASSTTTSSSATSVIPDPPSPKKSNTGAIAGGVVGGVVVLAALAFGIFFLLRRNKKQTPSPPPPVAQQWNPQSPQMGYAPQSPGFVAPYPHAQEQKPQVPGDYYAMDQSGYSQQPLYNSHMSQQYAETPQPMHSSPNQQPGAVFGGELPAHVPSAR